MSWWRFNSGDGSSQLDERGGHHFAQTNVNKYGTISNNAIWFSGTSSNQGMYTVTTNLMNGWSNFMISAWVLERTASSYAPILTTYPTTLGHGGLYGRDTTGWWGYSPYFSYAFYGVPARGSGTWLHLVLAYKGTHTGAYTAYLCLYTNGGLSEVYNYHSALAVTTNAFQIGTMNNTYKLNGGLDDLRVYNDFLTNKVRDIYLEGRR